MISHLPSRCEERLTLRNTSHGLGKAFGFLGMLGVELESVKAMAELEWRVITMGALRVCLDGIRGLSRSLEHLVHPNVSGQLPALYIPGQARTHCMPAALLTSGSTAKAIDAAV